MSENPNRRWFQFRLRTLLVGVALLSIPYGWTAYQLNWIRERRAILSDSDSPSWITHMDGVFHNANGSAVAPWSVRIFGEAGCYELYTIFGESSPEVAKLRRLFPEARIFCDQR